MEIIIFVICVISIALGFALACLIFAVLLSRSNDIGNSVGMVEDYKIDISFDISSIRDVLGTNISINFS